MSKWLFHDTADTHPGSTPASARVSAASAEATAAQLEKERRAAALFGGAASGRAATGSAARRGATRQTPSAAGRRVFRDVMLLTLRGATPGNCSEHSFSQGRMCMIRKSCGHERTQTVCALTAFQSLRKPCALVRGSHTRMLWKQAKPCSHNWRKRLPPPSLRQQLTSWRSMMTRHRLPLHLLNSCQQPRRQRR